MNQAGNYTRIIANGVDVQIPPIWFSYQWAQDPIPGRWWCWDTALATAIQEKLSQDNPELYELSVTRYPIESFYEALKGNYVDKKYAVSLSTDRLAVPVIGVRLPLPLADPETNERIGVMIDGCHRLWARHHLGYDYIDVFQLPDEVEQQIRMSPETIKVLQKVGML